MRRGTFWYEKPLNYSMYYPGVHFSHCYVKKYITDVVIVYISRCTRAVMRKRHYSKSSLKTAIQKRGELWHLQSEIVVYSGRPEGVNSKIPAIPSREMTATARCK